MPWAAWSLTVFGRLRPKTWIFSAPRKVDSICSIACWVCPREPRRLVVVDTVQTGNAPPGTIYQFRDSELASVPGGSPHYVGLCEALALARELGLPAAEEVIILAVEAGDCLTVGAEMSPQARTALPVLLSMIRSMMLAATALSTG